MNPLRVCIFDRTGHPQLSTGLQALSDVEVVAQCTAWETLQEALAALGADAVVIFLDEPEISSGFLLTQRIHEVAPQLRLIGISENHRPDTIIKAMRAGCNQFVAMPIDVEDLRHALDAARRSEPAAPVKSQRVCVMGAAGGAGATTIACNLAIELSQFMRQRVALVDMNLEFADVACHFDAQPKCGIVDVCRPDVEIDQTLLQSALTHMDNGVSILSKPAFPAQAMQVDPVHVETMFARLAEAYPYVVADVPRSFSPVTVAVLSGADRVLLVTQLAVPFIRNATRIYEHLLHMGANEEAIEIIVNRSNASYEMITPKEVSEHFGRPVFGDVPNDYKRLTSVRDLGSSLSTEAPNSPARLGIQALAKQLCESVGRTAAPVSKDNGSGSLLSRLWGRGKAKVRST